MAQPATDDDVVATMQKQESEPGFIRVASLFAEDQPEWNCGCCTLQKKSAVETIGRFILFCGMMGYIVYQLAKYFDPNVNREEYVDISVVDAMPMSFIYMDWHQANDTNCTERFGFWNGTSYQGIDYEEWTNWGSDPDDVSIQDLFDYVDNDNNCEPTYIKYEYRIYYWQDFYTAYWQFLFIPASGKNCPEQSIDVTSKNNHNLFIYCNYQQPDEADDVEPGDNAFWTLSGHREQLYEYDNLGKLLRKMWGESDARYAGYEIGFVYDWFSFDNNVDGGTYYDYYDFSIDGTYEMETETDTSNTTNVSYSLTYFTFAPNDIGTKTTFVTEAEMDFLDIFGLAGGMYSSIEQILAYFTVAAIWGCSFGCCKVSGVANEAGPDGLMRQQMEGFLKARDETILELTHRIVELEERVGVEQPDADGRVSAIHGSKNGKKRVSSMRRTDTLYNKTATPKKGAMKGSPNQVPMMNIATGTVSEDKESNFQE